MLEIIDAGGLTTIQDTGRRGWRRFGVPASGPMDEFALRAANLLVGNTAEAAALETGGGDLVLRATGDCVIAVAGAGYDLTVNTWKYPLWGSYFVRGGWSIQLGKLDAGMWAYLAVAGGLEAQPVLGSRSTYLRGRFGGMDGRSLLEGDVLNFATPVRAMMEMAGRTLSEVACPRYGVAPVVEVVLGPQHRDFTQESVDAFLSSPYRVSMASDRMGYRLEGPALTQHTNAGAISEGIVSGAIQVPADGAPIVMMADSATTGGYPKIACVIRADQPLLAQCRPGKDEVHFRETNVEAAQQKYRELIRQLNAGITEAE